MGFFKPSSFKVTANGVKKTIEKTKNTVYIPDQTYKVNITFASRRFITTVTYNFGKVKIQQRDIKGNDDDKKRLGH